MEAESQKRGWLPRIPELVGVTAQVIGVIVVVVANVEPNAIIVVSLIIYGVVMFVLVYRKREEDKHQLAVMKLKHEAERDRDWIEKVQKPTLEQGARQGAERMARYSTYMNLISTFEKTVNENTSLSDQQRAVYREVIERLKDMQSASQF